MHDIIIPYPLYHILYIKTTYFVYFKIKRGIFVNSVILVYSIKKPSHKNIIIVVVD